MSPLRHISLATTLWMQWALLLVSMASTSLAFSRHYTSATIHRQLGGPSDLFRNILPLRRKIRRRVKCWSKNKSNISLLFASSIENSFHVDALTDDDESYRKNQLYNDRFGGVGRLYSGESLTTETVLERIRQAVVVVVGLGGVGSWTAEALARSGIGNLVLIDCDDVCISNTNRQVHATSSGVGKMKIDVMKDRLLDIHPDCNITLIHDFVTVENAMEIVKSIGPVTALVDAIDGSTEKAALLATCTELAIPVITCGGAAGRRDPFQIATDDLVHVEEDRLLSSCRRILRRQYGFPAGLPFSQQRTTKTKLKLWRIHCVYTREASPTKRSPSKAGTQDDETEHTSSSFRVCDGSLGTACFVTGSYGFAAASICVHMIAQNSLLPPQTLDKIL